MRAYKQLYLNASYHISSNLRSNNIIAIAPNKRANNLSNIYNPNLNTQIWGYGPSVLNCWFLVKKLNETIPK